MKRFQKIFLSFLVLAQLLPAQVALAISFPSTSSILRTAEDRYHINPSTLQNFGENVNVSDSKMISPEVMVSFSPNNPIPGKEITAQAAPLYFSNNTNQLYFTWYLKRTGCSSDETVGNNDENKYCDLDDNGKIDENDWKIEAMRILANAGYTPTTTNGSDHDGYQASFGGDGGTTSSNYCYIQDFTGGTLYELSPSNNQGTDFHCPSGTVARCVEDVSTICSEEFIAYSEGGDGGAAGSGGSGGSGGSVIFDDSGGSTTSSGSGGSGGSGGAGGTGGNAYASGSLFREYLVCKDTGISPTCTPNSRYNGSSSRPGTVSCYTGTPQCVGTLPTTPLCGAASNAYTCSSRAGSRITSCSVTPPSSTRNSGCVHLFPSPKAGVDRLGNNKFDKEEEEFWTTDPSDPDTAGTGYGDEANLVGLGQRDFTWVYEVGDEVGVVVEGTSLIPTKHNNRSYAVMWALAKNICPISSTSSYVENIQGYDVTIPTANTDINNCLEANLVDPREGGQTGRLKVNVDYTPKAVFNDASGDDRGTTLSVFASADNTITPENLLYYDWTIYVSSDGTFNPRGYNTSAERDTTGSWQDITAKLKDNKLVTFTEGNGIGSIDIKLNIQDDVFTGSPLRLEDVFEEGSGYLKVAVKIREYVDIDGKTREDAGTVIIPITSTNKYISAKSVSIENDKLQLKDTICDELIVTDPTDGDFNPLGLGRNVCLVSRNEIIGLEFSSDPGETLTDFQWTVNGQPLNCTNEMSTRCNNSKATNVNFFPVMGEVGQLYTIELAAINSTSGKRMLLSRTFQVIDPMVRIRSEDRDIAWPKYLGFYKDDTKGYAYENLSEDQFQAYAGNSPVFSVEFFPSWVKDRSKWDWSINGSSFGENVRTVQVPLSESSPGDVYTLSVDGSSFEDSSFRKALNDFWGYSIFESDERYFSHTIDLQAVVNEESELLSISSPKALFASIAQNASGQILFMVQLLLSLATIVIFMGVVLSISNRQEK